ncbi:MAG: Unknown protein [uncultured Sulfurovum sp.]|uniref:DUF4402 domain-containing protein n=1 Tax=uncultured Sulfurovum sp. TaxID=269237 RepID=A0A6S6RS64_9BACT|nr:MAG: Unknown protein [uncultured Sulfurovum sp.]
MKKTLIVLSMLLPMTPLFSADNQIVVTGVVLVDAIVSFEQVSDPLTEAVSGVGTFKDSVSSNIDLGDVGGQGEFTNVSRNIYVKTNTNNTVSIKLEDPSNKDGYICPVSNPSSKPCIAIKYYINGSRYDPELGNTEYVDLVTGVNDGQASIGTFEIKPRANILNTIYMADDYTTALNVTVSVN